MGGVRFTNASSSRRDKSAQAVGDIIHGRAVTTKLSIPKFSNVIECLGPEQKSLVRECGFGTLLDLKCSRLPRDLSVCLAKWFDCDHSIVNIPNVGSFEINAFTVHQILGIPMGGRSIDKIATKEAREVVAADTGVHGTGPSRMQLLKLLTPKLIGDKFVRVFMLIMLHSFLCPTSYKCASPDYFNGIQVVNEIVTYDWCEFVLEWLVDKIKQFQEAISKPNVPGKSQTVSLGGCLLIPVLTFFDYVDLKHSRIHNCIPRLPAWDNKAISSYDNLNLAQLKLKDVSKTAFYQRPSWSGTCKRLPIRVSHCIQKLLPADEHSNVREKMEGMCKEFYISALSTCFDAMQDILERKMCTMVETFCSEMKNGAGFSMHADDCNEHVEESSQKAMDHCANVGRSNEDHRKTDDVSHSSDIDASPATPSSSTESVDDWTSSGCIEKEVIVPTAGSIRKDLNQYLEDVGGAPASSTKDNANQEKGCVTPSSDVHLELEGNDGVVEHALGVSKNDAMHSFVQEANNNIMENAILVEVQQMVEALSLSASLFAENSAQNGNILVGSGVPEEKNWMIVYEGVNAESNLDRDEIAQSSGLISTGTSKTSNKLNIDNNGCKEIARVSTTKLLLTYDNSTAMSFSTASERSPKRSIDLVTISTDSEFEVASPLKMQKTRFSYQNKKERKITSTSDMGGCSKLGSAQLAAYKTQNYTEQESNDPPVPSIREKKNKRLIKVPKSLASPSFCVNMPGKRYGASKVEREIFLAIRKKKYEKGQIIPVMAHIGRFWVDEKNFNEEMRNRQYVGSDVMDVFCEAINSDQKMTLNSPNYKYCMTSDAIAKLKTKKVDYEILKRLLSIDVIGIHFYHAQLVMMPICDNIHWWLICANMRDRRFDVLNSAGITSDQQKLTTRICNNFREFYHQTFNDKSIVAKRKFPVEKQRCPLQKSIHNCGIFIMKFIEQWDGRSALHLSQDDVHLYRQKLTYYIISHRENKETTDEMKRILQNNQKD